MPNAPIEFILVRAKGGKAEPKYVPRAKYEAQRDLWAQVAGGKTVTADRAPVYEPTTTPAPSGEKKSSGHSADTTKES